jgi:hypothetical protein
MRWFHWINFVCILGLAAIGTTLLYANELGVTKSGTVFQDCSACPQMVVIPAGSFMMGSPETDKDARDDERPQHKVTIAKPFAVSRFEVTFAEWNTCIDAGGCEHRPSAWFQAHGRLALRQHATPTDPGWCQGARPVINVSWDDITKQYLTWLNRVTGQAYRLLTEAEWEYAARAGKTTRYSWGDDPGEDNANCDGCKSHCYNEQPAPVGSFKPNDFGLYDMHGNVCRTVIARKRTRQLPGMAPPHPTSPTAIAFFEVAPGSAIRGACARRSATGSIPTTGSTATASVLPAIFPLPGRISSCCFTTLLLATPC